MTASAWLVDSTLREGLQAPGVRLSLDRKLRLVDALAEAGIEEVELGPAVPAGNAGHSELSRLVQGIRARHPALRVGMWCRALPDDVAAACDLGPDVVSFAMPVSDLHLRHRLGRSPQWAMEQVGVLADQARARGAETLSVGLEDATRAERHILDGVVRAARQAGVDRIRVSDTVGVATPGVLADLVLRCARRFPRAVGVHAHNDFGMATANAVAALDAGAAWADVSLLGLGERAGIARTQEVAAFRAVRAGRAGYDCRRLREACRLLASWLGRPIAPDAPVLGEDLFVCESGLHVGLVKDPRTYQPYPPELVGARQQLQLGPGSGRNAVAAVLGTPQTRRS